MNGQEPVAIVGMGCRLPGGVADPQSLWQLVSSGTDAIVEVPADRWNSKVFYHPDPASRPGTVGIRLGGFLDRIDEFDAGFFGISPREAALMDPQQRLLLECAFDAVDDSGSALERLSGTKVGVFVGIAAYDYAEIQHCMTNREMIGPHTNTGLALSIAANRISYIFNFTGPSVAVDTACSSSLVALHLACQSLAAGESKVALVGGVNAILKPEPTIGFSRASMLAPDGRCKTFDARANGYTRGEGAGVVMLKPLSAALADGDRVYAVIRGSAVNQDGRTNGMTVPGRAAQEEMLREAYARAGVNPGEVQYVEAHGTGTPVGDPIEVQALGAVLSTGRSSNRYCVMGSVKTNIGHLEAAAGIAGLMKAALAIQHRQIPPNLNFQTPNPEIPFDELLLRVPQTLEDWPQDGNPARAGVNSFGFGGTNAHVVLEEAPRQSGAEAPRSAEPEASDRLYVLPISARTQEALQPFARAWRDLLAATEASDADSDTAPALRDLCWSAAMRRSHHDHRMALVVRSRDELLEKLDDAIDGRAGPGIVVAKSPQRPEADPAWVFSGMGPQWWAMGRQLLEQEPLFRRKIEECDAYLGRWADWSLMREMRAEQSASRMNETQISQPANFALQVGLAALWREWGIRPSAIVGHSTGEVAAFHIAGALDLEEACRVIFHRSRLQQKASGTGKMVAAAISMAEAEEMIRGVEDRVSIAAVNSPTSMTLAGDEEPLREIVARLDARGIFTRFLTVEVPFHSHHMDPLRDELLEVLADLRVAEPTVPLYSTVVGDLIDVPVNAAYWWRNVRNSVLFADAIERMGERGLETFLEIGPHPVLSSQVSECLSNQRRKAITLPSLRRETDERGTMLASLAALYVQGYAVEWAAFHPDGGKRVRMPGYPWQRERHWSEPQVSLDSRLGRQVHPLLGRRLDGAAPGWEIDLDKRLLPYLDDHRVEGTPIYPGAGYVEMALAAAREVNGPGACVVEELRFHRALVLADDRASRVQVLYEDAGGEPAVTVSSRAKGTDAGWLRHAEMRIRQKANFTQRIDLQALRARCGRDIGAIAYEEFLKRGLQYGPCFQGIADLWQGEGEALGRVRVPAEAAGEAAEYLLHPTLLDACFQVMLGTLLAGGIKGAGDGDVYLPVRIGRLQISGALDHGQRLWAHARLTARDATMLEGDIRLVNDQGDVLVEVQGFHCQALRAGGDGVESVNRWLHAFRWEEKRLPGQRALVQPADWLPACADTAAAMVPDLQRLATDLDRARYYAEIEPELDALCTGFILEAFARLGRALRPEQKIVANTFANRLGVAEQHQRLFARLLGILGEAGVLEATENGWQVSRLPEGEKPRERLARLQAAHPEFAPELTLIGRSGAHLDQVLRGDKDPLQFIFPDGSLAEAEVLYRDSRTFGTYNRIVESAVRRMAAALPEGRRLRILEIGAGTGALAAHLLPVLPADRTDYVYTDVSTAFTAKAEQRFKAHPFVQYRLLDIEREPETQGFDPKSFDLVLASDVLHATADLDRTMRHVEGLLAPDGVLVMLELTRPPFWFDMVFGMLKGWWLFEDTELRQQGPWMGEEKWAGLLGKTGYRDVAFLADREEGATVHSVVLARAAQASAGEAPAQLAEGGRWLLLTDRGGAAQRLAAELEARGQTVLLAMPGQAFRDLGSGRFEVRGEDADSVRALLQAVALENPECRGVVHLATLDAPVLETAGREGLEDSFDAGAVGVMHLVQGLATTGWTAPPRLVLVTSGSQQVGAEAQSAAVLQAPVWGLGRVIANEHPELACAMIDIGPGRSPEELGQLAEECLAGDREAEVALRGHSRFVARLQNLSVDALRREGLATRPVRPDQPFRLDVVKTGALENLILREIERVPPGPGQVEIRVAATGLNFRDVMKVMGIYPTEGDEVLRLGDECGGVVTAVGEGVTSVRPGDRVAAIAPGFGSYLTVAETFVVPIPDHVAFEDAATIPITFLTAWYALHYLARIRKGERILVHAAAGGVGLAAIQIAQQVGAEVFATAGSPEKRAFLRDLGVEHIMDSRSTDFAAEVLEKTDGQGVDLVLNSLAGDAIPKSLGVLRAYGRFLEIGKTDIYQNSKIGLRPFRNNLSYFAIDLDRVFRERPELAGELFREVMTHFQAGELRPLPRTVFPISQAEGAFRYMAQAKHIGKIVLTMHDPEAKVAPRAFVPLPFRADGTYLMTGGLGGFGLAVAQWMVEKGARNLVLLGRSGAAGEAAVQAVEAMRAAGAKVAVVKADVTDEARLRQVLDEVRASMPPLRGVLHAAMVLDDGFLAQLDRERMLKVLRPKVLGAWALHRLTEHDPLDMFVMFSSFATMIGNPGQGNYSAANAFLDSLALYRRARNRPALTVNWGAIGEVGYVAEHGDISRHFERQGLTAFTRRQALAVIEQTLRGEIAHVGAVHMDWPKWGKFMPEIANSPRFAHLAQEREDAGAERQAGSGGSLLETVLGASLEQRQSLLESCLCEQLATVLGTSAGKLDAGQPLADLGLDSLMAVELSCLIEDHFGVKTPTIELVQTPSISKLAERLLGQIAA